MNDPLAALLKALGPMTYRERLDRRFPEMYDQIKESAHEMLKIAQSPASDAEVNEFVANNEMVVIDGIFGMLNAVEVLSQGRIASRSRGSAPMNVVAAFTTWLWQNPEVCQKFRESDLFKELIASGEPGFEWPDSFDEEPLSKLFDNDEMPGNYI